MKKLKYITAGITVLYSSWLVYSGVRMIMSKNWQALEWVIIAAVWYGLYELKMYQDYKQQIKLHKVVDDMVRAAVVDTAAKVVAGMGGTVERVDISEKNGERMIGVQANFKQDELKPLPDGSIPSPFFKRLF